MSNTDNLGMPFDRLKNNVVLSVVIRIASMRQF